jgi:FkbM family methyltransferase
LTTDQEVRGSTPLGCATAKKTTEYKAVNFFLKYIGYLGIVMLIDKKIFLHNPYIPLTLRKKFGNLKNLPKLQPFRIKLFNHVYEGTTGNHIDDKIALYGMHEASTIRLMRNILSKQKSEGIKPIYIDIGTNSGMHIIALADLYECGVGFEPWKLVFDKAQKNININKFEHIQLFNFGLSDQNNKIPFFIPEGENLGIGAFIEGAHPSSADCPKLEVRNGDEIINQLNISPTLIKIDVEGHEKKVLQGLKDTIKQFKPDIVKEYNDLSRNGLRAYELHEILGNDYNFYGIHRSREWPKISPLNPSKKYENILITTKKISGIS